MPQKQGIFDATPGDAIVADRVGNEVVIGQNQVEQMINPIVVQDVNITQCLPRSGGFGIHAADLKTVEKSSMWSPILRLAAGRNRWEKADEFGMQCQVNVAFLIPVSEKRTQSNDDPLEPVAHENTSQSLPNQPLPNESLPNQCSRNQGSKRTSSAAFGTDEACGTDELYHRQIDDRSDLIHAALSATKLLPSSARRLRPSGLYENNSVGI